MRAPARMLWPSNAADAHGDAARQREAPFKQQQVAIRQEHAIGDVEAFGPRDAEKAAFGSFEDGGEKIAVPDRAALGGRPCVPLSDGCRRCACATVSMPPLLAQLSTGDEEVHRF